MNQKKPIIADKKWGRKDKEMQLLKILKESLNIGSKFCLPENKNEWPVCVDCFTTLYKVKTTDGTLTKYDSIIWSSDNIISSFAK